MLSFMAEEHACISKLFTHSGIFLFSFLLLVVSIVLKPITECIIGDQLFFDEMT